MSTSDELFEELWCLEYRISGDQQRAKEFARDYLKRHALALEVRHPPSYQTHATVTFPYDGENARTELTIFEAGHGTAPEGYDETGCQCPPGDSKFLLTIEDGQADLVHTVCGKQPPASWGDWHDLVTLAPLTVTVEWVPECDGSMWHGDHRCDCGASVQLTPAPGHGTAPGEGQ